MLIFSGLPVGVQLCLVLFAPTGRYPIAVTGVICWGRRTSLGQFHVFLSFFFFFTCKEREKEWNYPQVSERRNKVIFFFFFLLSSARLIISFFFLSFFFFSSFLFSKSLLALRVSQISLCLDCTGINGYSLYTCNESRLWTDSLIVMIMLRIMLRRYLISCSAILSFL